MKHLFYLLAISLLVAGCDRIAPRTISVIPMPQEVTMIGTPIQITSLVPDAGEMSDNRLSVALALISASHTGLKIGDDASKSSFPVIISVDPSTGLSDEGYEMDVDDTGANIAAATDAGAFYALQTLSQLIFEEDGKYYVNQVSIKDSPAFAMRGFMHDVGRNFQTIESLKHQLDIFARYKINVFQWHLTDNPAWRIECKVYPQLNDPQYQKKGHNEGEFYTYDQIRDLIAYAADRNIMVIPEIDVPGHSAYFKPTFGFEMASKQGMDVLEKCFNEFFTEIPAESCPYMHIGSDEVHISNPKEFMSKMEGVVEVAGRIPIIWDPGLPARETTVRQVWRDGNLNDLHNVSTGKTPVLDSYMGYINYFDPITLVQRIFLHNACDTVAGNDLALGGILCCWPDTRVDDKAKIFKHNAVYPSMLAFAERYWRGGDSGYRGNKNIAPEAGTVVYAALQEFEDRMMYHRNTFLRGQEFPWVPNVELCWRVSDPMPNGGNKDSVFSMETSDVEVDKWHKVYGGTVDVSSLASEFGWAADDSVTVYAIAYVHSDKAQTLPCWIGFEAPARSNRQAGGIPEQGHWDANGGDVWVNGVRLTPPTWNEPGAYRYMEPTWHNEGNEIPYTDEQLYWARIPQQVTFNEGVNKVMIKVPKDFKAQRWIFTFVSFDLVDGDLCRASGLVFADS